MVSVRGILAVPLIVIPLLMFFNQHLHLEQSFFGEDSKQGKQKVPVPPPSPIVPAQPSQISASSVRSTMVAIDTALRSKGGVYASYSCKTVSWDDVSRGTVGDQLSVWGPNIADTRLWAKNGAQLYTVRSDNWNEKLGRVSADEVALVASKDNGPLRPVTLRDFLTDIGKYGHYAGLPAELNLSNANMDAEVSVRFQTTFLPVSNTSLAAMEFAPEMYSYQTVADSDPRNLLLLATTQGVAIQQDGHGATRLYSHVLGDNKQVSRHWFEAERSKHAVGGQQNETKEEKLAAASRGKATASVIGTRAMGTRFNVLATVQVPLKQAQRPREQPVLAYAMLSKSVEMEESEEMAASAEMDEPEEMAAPTVALKSLRMQSDSASVLRSAPGQANAARVSKGSFVDHWQGLTVSSPKRDDTQHVTITFVLYNTVAGGVPSEKDVVAAVDDMEQLYNSCGWNGKRAEVGASFSTAELTVKNMNDITSKQSQQPYKEPVQDSETFPTSRTEGL
jgi:huntingtin